MAIYFIFLCSFLSLGVSIQLSSCSKLKLPLTFAGPESLAFDATGGGPYVGLADGRVLKFQGSNNGFAEFAVSASNRTKGLCDGTSNPHLSFICGRPLGLSFSYLTGNLYMVDPYYGLTVVGSNGGVATELAIAAEGLHFRFPFDLDVDPTTGIVYFTDASAVCQPRSVMQSILSSHTTGRLLKYDPTTKEVTVLLRGLSGAVGTAVSSDGTFILVSEFMGRRIHKYWLKGPKANTAEIFMNLDGNPSKIMRNQQGHFWVAVNKRSMQQPAPITAPAALKIDAFGRLLETVDLSSEYINQTITVVQEHLGALYVGSGSVDYIGVYNIYGYFYMDL